MFSRGVTRSGPGWVLQLVSTARIWNAGGNCSIRDATRRRHAVTGLLVLPNPRLVACVSPRWRRGCSHWLRSPGVVVSSQARGECGADLCNELVRMIEVVPADAYDVPPIGLEVALALALAGK